MFLKEMEQRFVEFMRILSVIYVLRLHSEVSRLSVLSGDLFLRLPKGLC